MFKGQRKLCCHQKQSHGQTNGSRIHDRRRRSLLNFSCTGTTSHRQINERRESSGTSSFVLMRSFAESFLFSLLQRDIFIVQGGIELSRSNDKWRNRFCQVYEAAYQHLPSWIARHEMIPVNEPKIAWAWNIKGFSGQSGLAHSEAGKWKSRH